MTAHVETWRLWLQRVAGLDGTVLESLAEALALAAPQGPLGLPCVDTCRCHEEVPSALSMQLFTELVENGVCRLANTTKVVAQLKHAITLDTINHSSRPPIVVRDLARVDVIVSGRNGDVAHARRCAPRTWATISEMAEREKNR